jgi:hypothetical protein
MISPKPMRNEYHLLQHGRYNPYTRVNVGAPRLGGTGGRVIGTKVSRNLINYKIES